MPDGDETRPLQRDEVERVLDTAAGLPASSNLAFVTACGVGAAALAVVFGAADVRTVAVIYWRRGFRWLSHGWGTGCSSWP